MRLAVAVLAVVGCGGGGAPANVGSAAPPPASAAPVATKPVEATVKRVRKPSTLGPSLAALPHAIEGLPQSLPLESYVHKPTETDVVGVLLGKDHYSFIDDKKMLACANPLIDKITGIHEPTFVRPLELEGAKLIHGLSLDELVRCATIMGDKRKKSKDKRVAEMSFTVFTQVAPDWILWTPNTKGVAAVLASTSTAPNPLAALLATEPESPEWFARGIDYTWELMAVSSVGAVFEYAKADEAGPITARFMFADEATAKQARDRVHKLPDDIALKTAFGELVQEVLDILRTRASITVDGTEVIVRGTVRANEGSENPFSVFAAMGIPVTRPVKDYRGARPLPAN